MADDRLIHDPNDASSDAGSTDASPSHGNEGATRDRPLVVTGSSHAGEPGYDGAVQVSAEGAEGRPEEYGEPFDRPDNEALDPDSVPEETRRAWAKADDA